VAVGPPELAAFAVGGLVAHRTHDHIYTLVAGMSVFWLVGYLV
jgi:branched-subunit amino acid transport protein